MGRTATGTGDAYERCQEDGSENFTDAARLDEFLLGVRKEHWDAGVGHD